MSDKKIKNLIKEAKNVRLSENEKNSLRDKILEFISFNPIRGKTPIVRDRNYISVFEVRYFMKATSLALICILVVGGSGISYAAAKALPGETLYTVKVNINENIEETFATTPKAKLAVQSAQIQRRLDEAHTLRKENRLSPEIQDIVIKKLDEHTQKVSKSIETLNEKGDVDGALEATSSLSPIFETNKEIFIKDSEKNEESNKTEILIAKLDDNKKIIEDKENSIIATVMEEADKNASAVVLMSEPATTTTTFKTDTPTKEELAKKEIDDATNKAFRDVREISRQISTIVDKRIYSAKEKINVIKLSIEKEEVLAKEKQKLEEEKLNQLVKDAVTATDTSLEIKITPITSEEKNVSQTQTKESVVPTITETSSIVKTETTPTITEVKTESDIIKEKIKEAEKNIQEAERYYAKENFKEALTLAQKVNRLIGEIENLRRLKTLELTQKIDTKDSSQKAEINSSIKPAA